jgi:methionyl-tRNA formyltransferase
MRIVFMGSPDFAVPGLKKLANSQHDILAVVSGPDKRRGRGSKKEPTDVKRTALELKLPVIDVVDLNERQFQDNLQELSPDLLVVVAFRILPSEVLEIPYKGSVNLHASLLPKYRGAAPIHHAIMNGETETGCTVFFISEKVDTGLIIDRKKTIIRPDETTGELYDRLKILGADLLLESINKIESGNYEPFQQDHNLATPAPKLFKEDARINFNMPGRDVHNKIRGLSPFPGAWCKYEDKKMNLYRSRVGPDLDMEPGDLILRDHKLLAGCKEGSVELVEVQLPGTKRMSGPEFANGYELKKLN